jgi:asparagine synthase (glutamine-hydrolysing)
VLHFSAVDTEPITTRLASTLGATALFDGEFGDNLFGSSPREEVLGEAVARYGFGPQLFGAAMDYARLKRLSIWKALSLCLHERLSSRPAYYSVHSWDKRYRDKEQTNLLAATAMRDYEADLERFVHPWLKNVADLPAGKFLLVFGLINLTSTAYHSPFGTPNGPEPVAPLVSQPLIEAILRIPSRFTYMRGDDRAVARDAFRDELPSGVINRATGKGTPLMWVKRVVERNRGFLRETLLDGVLVKERILDRHKLERLLSGDVTNAQIYVSDVFVQLYIEAWLRRQLDDRPGWISADVTSLSR